MFLFGFVLRPVGGLGCQKSCIFLGPTNIIVFVVIISISSQLASAWGPWGGPTQGVVTCDPGVWLVWLRVGKPPVLAQGNPCKCSTRPHVLGHDTWGCTPVPLSWQLGVNETEFAFGIGDKEKQRNLDWLLGQRSIRMHHRGLRPALGSLGMRENQSG